MATTLVLWGHALAALVFGTLALWAWRAGSAVVPHRPLIAALALTGLWALAVAGIGGAELATRIAETGRNLAWLSFMLTLHRRDGSQRPPLALGSVYGVVALVAVGALAAHLVVAVASRADAAEIDNGGVMLRMLVAVAALVLMQALHTALNPAPGSGLRLVVLALGCLWLIDFVVLGVAYLTARWWPELSAVRGLVMLCVGIALGAGLQRRGELGVKVSRAITYQSLSLVAVGAYFALLALATSALSAIGGSNARVLQTAFVLGSTAAILTLVSNSWLRAWIKVKLAKHLFRHRYDYRAEWMRFTETLGAPQGAAPLEERIVKAIADLTDSPAGLLLVPDATGLGPGAQWNWDPAQLPLGSDAALAEQLSDGRIVDVDAARTDPQSGRAPEWVLEIGDAWVIVPLPHQGTLAGAILLARPPINRPLDWEDFDLLKVAGRQVASYLAEARAQEALAEAQRFDEFNRRFAFILHDIKNLVSQLTLTARNAERHADKPEFRADMVETLKDSAERMNALLARLSQHHRSRAETPQPVKVLPLVERVAAQHRRQHAVSVSGSAMAVAEATPTALEQLLGHLVQNAIEASDDGQAVTAVVASDGLSVTIDVIDQGCGMSPTFIRDKLFKPFVSSKAGGFGIGAFEARQLAATMGGQLEVTSREGQGTRFRVVLKAAHAADIGQAA